MSIEIIHRSCPNQRKHILWVNRLYCKKINNTKSCEISQPSDTRIEGNMQKNGEPSGRHRAEDVAGAQRE